MLKYLVILLGGKSRSFCHYTVGENRDYPLIPVEYLRQGIMFAMKHNLNLQIVWPDEAVPDNVKKVLELMDHEDIVPLSATRHEGVFILDENTPADRVPENSVVIVRLQLKALAGNLSYIEALLSKVSRLNIVWTDIDQVSDNEIDSYRRNLEILVRSLRQQYLKGHAVQLNIITDRIALQEMKNCNAGLESVTLAPDGKFYLCPAFYYEGGADIGNLESGLDIPNQQLYDISHAVICNNCDAWHCRRCIWLNKRLTREVNTPSRQQCVIAHLEREASASFLDALRRNVSYLPGVEIPSLDYLDPFDKINS